MNFVRKSRVPRDAESSGELPLTSMIDVVFLLLIFFLVTSQLGAPERQLPAALRTVGRSEAVSDLQPQIVRVRRTLDGVRFEIGGHSVATRQELALVLAQLPKDQGLIVRADDEVPVQGVADGLQAGVDAGFERRSYVPGS